MKIQKKNHNYDSLLHDTRSSISEVVREPTAGGVVFRRGPKTGVIEILLIQDAKDRWTIAKGHIEDGETASDCALREINEETGIKEMQAMGLISKVNFRFRRGNSLVLMTTEIFLIQALGATEDIIPEDWMRGIAWFTAADALKNIEYEDIGTAIKLGLKKIREAKL
jgi:ADP-ribose pyrophosphatase YjhB (NUDIX family)